MAVSDLLAADLDAILTDVAGETVTLRRGGDGAAESLRVARSAAINEVREIAGGLVRDPIDAIELLAGPLVPLADADELTFVGGQIYRVGPDGGVPAWRSAAGGDAGYARAVRIGPQATLSGPAWPFDNRAEAPASPDRLSDAAATYLATLADSGFLPEELDVRRVRRIERPRRELAGRVVADVAPAGGVAEVLDRREAVREHAIVVCVHGQGTVAESGGAEMDAAAVAALALPLLEGWEPPGVTHAAGTKPVACYSVGITDAAAPGLSRVVIVVRFREFTRRGVE